VSLTDRDRSALLAIAALRDADGVCRAMRWRLALESGLLKGAWQRAVMSLERGELITSEVVGEGNHRTTHYRLTASGEVEAGHRRATGEPPTDHQRATLGSSSLSSDVSEKKEEEEPKDSGPPGPPTETRPDHRPTLGGPHAEAVLSEALLVIRSQHVLIDRLIAQLAPPPPEAELCGCGRRLVEATGKYGAFKRCPDWMRCKAWRERGAGVPAKNTWSETQSAALAKMRAEFTKGVEKNGRTG
jgi:hypothetical protein